MQNPRALQPRVRAVGGCHKTLPKALVDKRCTLNIMNKDDLCFQYCVVAHKLKTYEMENKLNPHYLNHYATTLPRTPVPGWRSKRSYARPPPAPHPLHGISQPPPVVRTAAPRLQEV